MFKRTVILLSVIALLLIFGSCRGLPNIPTVSEMMEEARERMAEWMPDAASDTAVTPEEAPDVTMTPIQPRTTEPTIAPEPPVEFKYPAEESEAPAATEHLQIEPPAAGSDSTLMDQVAALVNEERIKAGLSPLTLDTTLSQNADVRAGELVRSFSHTRPDGRSPMTAITISYRTAGENIASGQRTAAEVMHAWMSSDGHRANILGKSYTKIGVGVHESGGRLYWVQLFVG